MHVSARRVKTPAEGYRELAAAIIKTNIGDGKFRASEWFNQLKAYIGHEEDEVTNIPSRAELFRAGPQPEDRPTKKELEKIQERKEAREVVLGNPMISEFMEFIW